MISPRFWSFMLAMLPLAATVLAEAPCRIQVVEQGTEWPVPLVELRSVHGAKWFSDNAGVVALDAPELMGRESYFAIASDGYEFPSDGFGFAGIRITPRPGATHRIEVKRTAIARRVGRLTGAGLFAESQKVGQFSNWTESGLLGCDSVLSVEHAGDRYWIWGDSNLAHYPLGIFNCSAARTKVRALQWTEPPLQPSFDYFRDPKTMRPRGVVDIEGEGPVWLTGLVSLPAENHAAKLVATYMQVKPPLEVYRYGLCVWDESTETFLRWKLLWEKSEENPEPPLVPKGHPVRVEAATGEGTLLFGDPFPTLRCPARFEAWQDPRAMGNTGATDASTHIDCRSQAY